MNLKINAGPSFSGVTFYETQNEGITKAFSRCEQISEEVKGTKRNPFVFIQFRMKGDETVEDIFIADKAEGKLLKSLEKAYHTALNYADNNSANSENPELKNILESSRISLVNAKSFFAKKCLSAMKK